MTREEAIKIIDCYDIGFYDLSGAKIPADKLADAFDMAIEALSAERTGKWVFRTDIPIGGGAKSAGYVCSTCGRDVYHRTEYCPGCGAKMGGDTE